MTQLPASRSCRWLDRIVRLENYHDDIAVSRDGSDLLRMRFDALVEKALEPIREFRLGHAREDTAPATKVAGAVRAGRVLNGLLMGKTRE